MKRLLAILLTVTVLAFPWLAQAEGEEDWVEGYQPQPGDYSIAVIPDIQELSARYPEKLNTIMQWIVDNQEKENIQFAVDVGDVTWSGHENNSNSRAQFATAANAFSILEKAGIPYSISYGNHDFVPNGFYRDTTLINSYFPYEEYSSWDSFGGCMEQGKLDNYYFTFEVMGVPYLILSLEWCPMTPTLNWGAQVVKDHPNHNVMVVTHGYYDGDGSELKPYSTLLWNNIISKYPNVFMMMSGHAENQADPGSMFYHKAKGEAGNDVHMVMANAQDIDYLRGGVGILLMLRFTNGGRTIDFNYFSPVNGGKAYKECNQFTVTLPEEQVIRGYYTLRYNTAGGSAAPEKVLMQPGQKPVAVEEPTKNNATFLGWYWGDTLVNLAEFVMPEQSVTLTAKWKNNVTYGDVNQDGDIDAADALEVLRVAVGKATFTSEQALAGDVDGSQTHDATDALYILQFAVDKRDSFPCED